MSQLSLYLLGPYQVTLNGRSVTDFRSDKVRALLAYLALETDRPHRRDALAGLFWPDVPDRTARRDLRLSLHRLRQSLDDLGPESNYFQITRETIQMKPGAVWVDEVAFTEGLRATESHAHRHLETCAPCMRRLAEAADLYQDEFLQGFFLEGCVAFSEWVLVKREWLHRQVLSALYHLAAHHRWRGELDRARMYAQRQLELEPWREEAHRQLMDILARCGETSAALAQYDICRRILAEELDVEPDHETKGLYERLRTIRARRHHNLPPQATPFVGREDELAQIREWLADPDGRLLTIVGPGGMGKTRLAIQAATLAADEHARMFLHGVTFVPLAGVEGPESLVPAIANALDFSFSGSEEPGEQLINYLRQQEMLLVLDSFEQVLDGTAFLLKLLARAPDIDLLVTTRQRLNLHWERLVPLEGLPYPAADEAAEGWKTSEAYDALRLFQTCARRVQPYFELVGETERAVIRTCQTVEGMPLAVELAAAWVGTLPVTEIATQIAHNLDLSATAMRHLPARHRSLRAVFDHAWDALSEEERLLLGQLSVFRGGFSREAILSVIRELPSVVHSQADHWLAALVDKSLLRFVPGDRYDLHELLRQYVAEKLAGVPELEVAARDRHCVYFASFLQRQEAGLNGTDAARALAAIKAEIANIRAAWYWAVTQARIEEIERSLNALAHFYLFTGPFQEGERIIGMAVGQMRIRINQADKPDRDEQMILSRLLTQQTRLLNRQGLYSEAVTAVRAAIDLARTSKAVNLEAAGFLQWGRVLWRQGDYQAARPQLEWALELARAVSLRDVEADSLQNLGVVAFNLGNYDEAQTYYEQVLHSYRAIGDRRGEGMALGNLGLLFNCQGAFRRAETCYKQALRVFQAIGDRQCEGLTLSNLGLLSHRRDDNLAARVFSQQALDVAQELGERNLQGYALTHLGYALMGLGYLAEAAESCRKAVALRRELGQRSLALESLAGQARVCLAQGRRAEAQTYVEEILAHLMVPTSSIALRHELAEPSGPGPSTGSGHGLEGTTDPIRVYLTCYRVLAAHQDPRAGVVLEMAYSLLLEQAARIADAQLRQSFLEGVQAHREVLAEWDIHRCGAESGDSAIS